MTISRSSCSQMLFKIGVLKNFTLFTGKLLCWSLSLMKLLGWRPCNFIKERLQHRYFPVNNVKFFRTHFFTEHLWWLLLYVVWANIAPVENVSCAMLSQLYLDNIVRSTCLQMVFKISVLKNFANFPLKHLCWSFFLIKLQPWGRATLLKRNSNTGAFLWILQIFRNTFLLQNTSGGCFCIVQVVLCNLGLSRSKQYCVGYFPSKSLLCSMGQHCKSNFLVQCSLRPIWTTLTRQYSYVILSQHGQYNIV